VDVIAPTEILRVGGMVVTVRIECCGDVWIGQSCAYPQEIERHGKRTPVAKRLVNYLLEAWGREEEGDA